MPVTESTNKEKYLNISIEELREASPEKCYEILLSLTREEIVKVMSPLTVDEKMDFLSRATVGALNKNAVEFKEQHKV